MAPDIETFLAEWAQDDHPPAPQTLSAWRRLLSDPSIPASSVAKEAVSHWAQRRVANPDPISIWRLMWDSVQKFTDHNDRIVDFLDELRKLPDCDGAFQSLPGLSEDMTEFIFDYLDHAWSPTIRDAERIGWKNVNLFTVKMHIRGIHSNGSGQLCRGSWVVRKTLEKAPWETFHHADIEDYIESWDSDSDDEEYCKRRDCELETIDIRTLDGWVPAAAQWFIYLGKEMKGRMVYRAMGLLEGKMGVDRGSDCIESKYKKAGKADGGADDEH
ncbi:uncharacterized protein N7459_000384 [Penicillium hispanicum]|uniref:uncharacterized protein n=1 Tax=Penicillium hispanicum TaxID=1080232 RepID=UPI00253FE27E|nr:uncharacterized protein N7459_000384 [Penicillium hispanicum]KAJ5594176.1 hypothetical protein N7459_000384 [Penicillium hispanicum]